MTQPLCLLRTWDFTFVLLGRRSLSINPVRGFGNNHVRDNELREQAQIVLVTAIKVLPAEFA